MSIRSALLYAFGTRYFAVVIQLLATLILARLLSPAEIGVYSVGAAVIMIAHTLRDFGTSTYVIQEPELTQARQRTAFTITLIVAWSLAIILWLASNPVAVFYREPGVAYVLKIMAINFILLPIGSVTMAVVRREMNFRAIMIITAVSTVVNALVSVLLAAMDYGYISLAWAGVCGTLATVLGTLLVRRDGFLLKPSLTEHRRVLAFSLRSSVSSIASEAGHAAPDLVLGRTVGMDGTGLFSRAMGFVQLFERLLQDVLRSVMLPYFSEEVRSGGDVRKKTFLALQNVASISWFIIGMTGILAKPLIDLLFGSQWKAAVPIAQVLCIAMAIRCVSPTLAAALVSKGQIRLVMRLNILSTVAKFVCLGLGSPFGLIYGAWGFVLAEAFGMALILYYTGQARLFSLVDYAKIGLPNFPAIVAGLSPAMVFTFYYPMTDAYLLNSLLVAGIGLLSLCTWLVALWTLDLPPKQELQQLLPAIRKFFVKRLH